MYCVYDNNDNIIAFHDDICVVRSYIHNINKSYNNEYQDLHIGKIKKKKLKNIKDLDNLYLVRYSDTYIQSGYLLYHELTTAQQIYDNTQCKDTLLKILECEDITDKERKSIERTVKIIDRILQDSKEYTLSLEDLRHSEMHYEPYFQSKGFD